MEENVERLCLNQEMQGFPIVQSFCREGIQYFSTNAFSSPNAAWQSFINSEKMKDVSTLTPRTDYP